MIRPAIAAALLAALAPAPAQQPTFRAHVEEVTVDVLAARDRKPVTGLTANDFVVRDNGVVQRIDHVAFEELPLNVILALDGSDSVRGDRLKHLRSASGDLLSHLKPVDQAALLGFGDAVVVRTPLTHDFDVVREGLQAKPPAGGTALLDASQTALLIGESQPGRALVLIFSDGIEGLSVLDEPAVFQAARRASAVVYGVTFKKVARPKFLDKLTDATGGALLEVESEQELDAAFARVLDEFRQRYVLSYAPQGVTANGWHQLDVRIKQPGIRIKARPGYFRD
jgi:VWFA-related protein